MTVSFVTIYRISGQSQASVTLVIAIHAEFIIVAYWKGTMYAHIPIQFARYWRIDKRARTLTNAKLRNAARFSIAIRGQIVISPERLST